MELTGGSELMMIAGHRAGLDGHIRMYYTDIAAGKIMDIDDPDFYNGHGAPYTRRLYGRKKKISSLSASPTGSRTKKL